MIAVRIAINEDGTLIEPPLIEIGISGTSVGSKYIITS